MFDILKHSKKKRNRNLPKPPSPPRSVPPPRPQRPQESLFTASWADPEPSLPPSLGQYRSQSAETLISPSPSSSITNNLQDFTCLDVSDPPYSERKNLISSAVPSSLISSSGSSPCSSYSIAAHLSNEDCDSRRSDLGNEIWGQNDDELMLEPTERHVKLAADMDVEATAHQHTEPNRLPAKSNLFYHDNNTGIPWFPQSPGNLGRSMTSPLLNLASIRSRRPTGSTTPLSRQPKTKTRRSRSDGRKNRSDSVGTNDSNRRLLSEERDENGSRGSWLESDSGDEEELSGPDTGRELEKGKESTYNDSNRARLRRFGISPVRRQTSAVAEELSMTQERKKKKGAAQQLSGDADDWFAREKRR